MEPVPVQRFREYIRIKSVHPTPDYEKAVSFLTDYGKELGLDVKYVHVPANNDARTIVVMTWKGTDPSLKSILLNSHTDVVPVYEEHWKHDAFAAIKDEKGDIYGRGTQDMKCVGIQYLEAIRKLKQQENHFKRTIYLTFMPDEEIGGIFGMKAFLQTEEFKKMNVGLALDEGLANPDNKYSVYYAERSPWWIRVKCEGEPGHGSRFIENTAAEKLRTVLGLFLDYREEQKQKLKTSACHLGDVTTLNLTKLEGGIAYNMVPAELSASFDIRIPPTVDLQVFEEKIASMCKTAGEGVSFEFIQKCSDQSVTSTDVNDPWWTAFTKGCDKFGVELSLEVFSGATDSRYLRAEGYPAIGFSPMRNTPVLLHDHNEFLNENIFMEGIDAYCAIIPYLANVESF